MDHDRGPATGRRKGTRRARGIGRAVRMAGAVAVLLAIATAVPVRAQEASTGGSHPALLTFGAGAFNFTESRTSGALAIEYAGAPLILGIIRPVVGAMANFDGGLYAYAGIAADLFLGPHLVLTPGFAPGLYSRGGGVDLGDDIEFRSSIALAWRFDGGARLGLDLNHISNAGLSDRNPGSNQLFLEYSLPLAP